MPRAPTAPSPPYATAPPASGIPHAPERVVRRALLADGAELCEVDRVKVEVLAAAQRERPRVPPPRAKIPVHERSRAPPVRQTHVRIVGFVVARDGLIVIQEDAPQRVVRGRVGPPSFPTPQAQDTEGKDLDNLVEGGHARGDAYDVAIGRAAPLTLHSLGPHADGVAHRLIVVAKRGQDDCERNRGVLIRRLDRDRQAVRLGQTARVRERECHQQTHHAGYAHAHVKLQRPGPNGPARVAREENPQQHERDPSRVTELPEVPPPLRPLDAGQQPEPYAANHHRQGQKQASVRHLHAVVAAVRVRQRQVDHDVHGQGSHGEEGARGGHRHGQREVAVEQRAPPVAVTATRRAHGDEQRDAVHRVVREEGSNAGEPREGQDDELAQQSDAYAVRFAEPLLELSPVHLRGEPEDQDEQDDVPRRRDRRVRHGCRPLTLSLDYQVR